jgi:hypothetical protein
LVLTLTAAARPAPTAEEQRLFTEGLRAFEAGDARAAERAWSDGYRIAHDPAFLVRVGEAEEKAGATAEALETYRRYLREAPDAADRPDIQQRIARLAPAMRTERAPAAPSPAEQPGEFGDGPKPQLPVGPAPRPAATDAEPPRRTEEHADSDSGWNRYNVTAMSAAGASVLLLGTAAFFGAEASSKESDINRLQSSRDRTTGAPITYSSVAAQYGSALSDGRAFARDAKIALGCAAGAAAVSVLFFVLDAHHGTEAEGKSVSLSPLPLDPSAKSGGLLAMWRF